ncbi:MAG TPA: Ig-like domain-containing protein, partial [Verrucomicrobiota bacterium]|nr:Ig-like domain-containing protein [Verrucomicrobiota bacterium]
EFWIIITADTSGGGTHKVEVYMNGSTNATTYYVTAGTGSDINLGQDGSSINDYIGLGLPIAVATGAYDIDFFGFKEGRWLPVVNPDTIGPDIVDANTYGSTNSIKITFSEPVDSATALNGANYVITNQYGFPFNVTNAYFFGDNKTVVVVVDGRIAPNIKYYVIANVKDLNGNLNSSVWWFLQASPAKAMVELFGGMGNQSNPYGSPDFRSITKFANRVPDVLLYSNSFTLQASLADTGWNYYVGRLSGYFVAPSNGLYRFYTSSDDGSLFYMNTNDVNSTYPEGKVQLTQLTGYTSPYGYNSGVVSNVFLKAGQRYYMELIWREGTGGDGAKVAVKSQNDTTLPTSDQIIPPDFLELPVGPITVATPPPSTINVPTKMTGLTLSAEGITGALPWSIQWKRSVNGTTYSDIAGATNSVYVYSQAISAKMYFRLTISNLFSSVSYDTVVTPVADTVAPSVAQVIGWSANQIRIVFSEAMTAATINNTNNYLLDNGAIKV